MLKFVIFFLMLYTTQMLNIYNNNVNILNACSLLNM